LAKVAASAFACHWRELRLAQRRPVEALPLAERSLRIHENTVGAQHPTVAAGKSLVTRVLAALGGVAAE